jgi:hypothetical protein
MLYAIGGQSCLPEVPEMLKGVCCVLLCALETVECRHCLLKVVEMVEVEVMCCAALYAGESGLFAGDARGAGCILKMLAAFRRCWLRCGVAGCVLEALDARHQPPARHPARYPLFTRRLPSWRYAGGRGGSVLFAGGTGWSL